VVTLCGKDYYLGRYGTADSRAEYDRLLAEWLTGGRRLGGSTSAGSADLTVNELIVGYLRFADGYYLKNGESTGEPNKIRLAMRPLRKLYGHTLARDFGPLALKVVRQELVRADLCRNEVNKRVGMIGRAFRWGVENELVPPSVHQALKAVAGLRRGRSEARESKPVRPVPEAHVDAIRQHVARQVWAMIELQRLTGMRSGEVSSMRTRDLDTSGRVWVYTPESHKTEHHGRERPIYIGPRAQAILRPWLRTELAAYLFSPREAVQEKHVEMRRARKTRVQPSQQHRRKRAPRKAPGERYDNAAYWRAIRYACDRANVPHWHPHQLRHNAATRLRKEFGIEVARIILGHSSPAITETYAEVDREKALEAMAQVG
jgi:integrase